MNLHFTSILATLLLLSCQSEEPPLLNSQCGTPSACPDIVFGCNGTTGFVLVDFEPLPFTNLVQTCPLHLDKEPMGDAFISVRLQRERIPWALDFWSEATDWASSFACMDGYNGWQQAFIFGEPDTLRLLLWDTLQAYNYLFTYEQLLVALEIKCIDKPEPAKPCDCKNLLTGYFENEVSCQQMEDYIISLPGEQPFSCQGDDLLEIAWNFEQHRVTFRSTDYRFCKSPVELWTYRGEPSPTAAWSCEAEVIEAQLDFNGHELDLELDEDFLLCAFEQEEGFWFALAVE